MGGGECVWSRGVGVGGEEASYLTASNSRHAGSLFASESRKRFTHHNIIIRFCHTYRPGS